MQCRDSVNSSGGGGGEVRAILEISRGGGLRDFQDPEGMRIYEELANFQDPAGWPMSDNDIFQGDTINTNINNKYCTSGLRLQVLYLFTKTRFTCHVPTHALSGLVVQTPVHLL